MHELAWFVAGGATAASLASLWLRLRRERPAPAAALASGSTANAAAPARTPKTAETRTFAATVAGQLASLTSGIESNAQLLIESAADPAQVARNAERMWHSVQRLRRLHDKLAAYVQPPPTMPGVTELQALMHSLRQELAQGQLGLMMSSHLPRQLPPVQGVHAVLHRALVGLCTALRHLERGAERLSVSAEADFDTDLPTIKLELHLTWADEPQRSPAHSPDLPAFELELGAAQNLLHSQGCEVQIMHQRGKQAQALVQLHPASDAEIEAPVVPPVLDQPAVEIPRPTHEWAGVLLIEHDPEVRALLASELKACGRAVFVCPDSAAARTLLKATPERFELLIVDHDAQLDRTGPLATAAAELAPGIKLCVVSNADTVDSGLPERVVRIQKPFGVLELRSALKTALAD